MIKRTLAATLCLIMVFAFIPVSAHADTPSIIGVSVFRRDAESATVRFSSGTAGYCYYLIDENPTATAEDLLSGQFHSILANLGARVFTSEDGLSSGAKYIHLMAVDDTDRSKRSDVLNIPVPYDVYYYDDFEAFGGNRPVLGSISANTLQMYIKYNGGDASNQKVIVSDNNKVLQTVGTYAKGLDIRTDLRTPISSGYAVLEADITPVAFGTSTYNAGFIFGKENSDDRPINIVIDSRAAHHFVAQALPGSGTRVDSDISCSLDTKYHVKIVIDVTNQNYDYYINGTKANSSKIAYSCSELNWFGFYNGEGTAYYDNIEFYATNSLNHTITYNANGGTGTMTAGTATQGTAFTLPACGFTAPAGKRFKEWAIGSTSGTKVAAGGTHSFTADTTVYAIWEDIPTTPAFTTHPSPQTVTAGTAATFTVTATGNPAPDLQWQVSTDSGANWSAISGATSASYTTPATTTAMNGYQYRCTAVSFVSAVTSSAATLTVNAAPIVVPTISISPNAAFMQGNAPETTVTVGAGITGFGLTNLGSVQMGPQGGALASLTAGTEYDATQGSIIITLHQAYLNTLTPGVYTLWINLIGVGYPSYVETTITVNAPSGGDVGADVPRTGDAATPVLWLGLILLAGAGLAVSAVRRKRQNG